MRPEQFTVVYQDTDAGPWDAGASGSQTTFNNGRAVVQAAIDVRDQLLELAEDVLEAARADLELLDGRVQVKGSPTTGVDLTELTEKAAGDKLLLGRGSGSPAAAARLRRLGVHRAARHGVVPRPDLHDPRGARARSTGRPASCGCSRWPRLTTPAGC